MCLVHNMLNMSQFVNIISFGFTYSFSFVIMHGEDGVENKISYRVADKISYRVADKISYRVADKISYRISDGVADGVIAKLCGLNHYMQLFDCICCFLSEWLLHMYMYMYFFFYLLVSINS
ncbi:hypothetical protein [Plasmodium yoelii yoelii]|uniref:Uncharacterized protein n=1 Tax=Plasmodium yoelii yoelii TaxID=73239 RepID=Q7RCP9_PLAYO|nr:hypothetical protein [Plasmodium yoelii yoelii]